MKNYSFIEKTAKEFILSYKIIDDTIVITKADNSIEILQFSLQNEQSVLERMKEQVIRAKAFFKNINIYFEIFSKLLLNEITLLVMFLVMKFSIGIALLPTIMGLVIFSTIMSITIYKLSKYRCLRDDIKKNLLFLNNEDCLNLAIRSNPKATEELPTRLKDKILSNDTSRPFTLNTIDKIKYRELKQIYNQVEKIVGRSKRKIRKRKNRN